MALQGNGQLLVRVSGQPFAGLFSAAPAVTLPGYALEPLSRAPQALPTFDALAPAEHWLLARPVTMAAPDPNPWNAAHAAARANGYAHYVEPDLMHKKTAAPPAEAEGGLNDNWPPAPADNVSPAWHLQRGFTGFADVRTIATGNGVRIAHLDTGYSPYHASKPRKLRRDLAYDYWDNKPDAVDPGMAAPGLNPGHGTATLALLAGTTLDLKFGDVSFNGDFGGAPDAEVVPVRICPSVIHLYTSTMAKGLYHALAPNDDAANRCDVVSISHGGLPSLAWAAAVNTVYNAGIVVVAASGDSIFLKIADIATRYTVYPSAFNRVITAVGATYQKLPYITDKFGVMQGCWGPADVMEKAVAGYTPNVAWMDFEHAERMPGGFDMNGGGTSASTPQVAAACALWVELYGSRLAPDWHRVEACRLALFKSTENVHPNEAELGRGMLRVPAMLDGTLADDVIGLANAGGLHPSAEDSVSFPFWRLLLGLGPPGSERERMYETEVAQMVLQSGRDELLAASRLGPDASFSADEKRKLLALLAAEPISDALRNRINQANAAPP